jgi:tetratricopeptide (TPR) repeat protein
VLWLTPSHRNQRDAVSFYRKALQLKPGMPGLRLNLGLALFKAGDLKGAIPEFATLLKGSPPNSAEALRCTTLLGMAHYGLGQFAKAAPYLKTAADADPQNLPIWLALAHSLLWSKQYSKVLDEASSITRSANQELYKKISGAPPKPATQPQN